MTEPFFTGSVTGFPMWSGTPWIGFGQQQPIYPTGGTPFGTSGPGIAAPYGAPPIGGPAGTSSLNYGVAPQYPLGVAPFAPSPGGFTGYGAPGPWAGFAAAGPGFGAGFPGFGTQDFSSGVTAPALVSAISMKRGQPMGPTSDREIEEVIYDALEWLTGSNDVEARCEGGRISLTGTVSNKRTKRDVGEIAWSIPSVTDVQNNVTITARRRGRPEQREQESQPATPRGKQS